MKDRRIKEVKEECKEGGREKEMKVWRWGWRGGWKKGQIEGREGRQGNEGGIEQRSDDEWNRWKSSGRR